MTEETKMTSLSGLSTGSKNMALVLVGSAMIAIAAQISVPMFPVPMTLQTLAISLIGLTFGARLAAFTVLAYLAQGALGLPVFANGGAGLVKLFGPTSGFLFGFVAMAFLTGWLVERGLSGGVFRLSVATLLPATMLYVPGVLGLWMVTQLDLSSAIMVGAVPFLLGDVVKAVLAAFVVAGGAQLLKRYGSLLH